MSLISLLLLLRRFLFRRSLVFTVRNLAMFSPLAAAPVARLRPGRDHGRSRVVMMYCRRLLQSAGLPRSARLPREKSENLTQHFTPIIVILTRCNNIITHVRCETVMYGIIM